MVKTSGDVWVKFMYSKGLNYERMQISDSECAIG